MYNKELAITSESLTNLFLKMNNISFTKKGVFKWNTSGTAVMNKQLELGVVKLAKIEKNCINGSKFREAFERKIHKH